MNCIKLMFINQAFTIFPIHEEICELTYPENQKSYYYC